MNVASDACNLDVTKMEVKTIDMLKVVLFIY
jgi:hypothetical protein